MRKKDTVQPWGRLVAMMTACFVTLIGALRGIDPLVVLKRAVLASLILGLTISIGCVFFQQLVEKRP